VLQYYWGRSQEPGAFSLPKPQVVSLTEDRPCDECGAKLVAGNRGQWYGSKFYGSDCHFNPKTFPGKGRNRTGHAFRSEDYGTEGKKRRGLKRKPTRAKIIRIR
jgi:hypothetical protein